MNHILLVIMSIALSACSTAIPARWNHSQKQGGYGGGASGMKLRGYPYAAKPSIAVYVADTISKSNV